jgi:hypothetical protein
MKQVYLLCAFTCAALFSNAQVVYQATTETTTRFNPGNDSIVVFDDAILNVGSPNTPMNLRITQLSVGIRRLANAPAIDVGLYLGRMNALKRPATIDSIGTSSLAAQGATAATVPVSITNTNGWVLQLDTISGSTNNRGFFVGVRLFGANAVNASNGWRVAQAPTVGTADTTFFNVNVRTLGLQGPLVFSPGTFAHFVMTVTGSVESALPVKLNFFKASRIGEGASLFWNVEQEINFKEYVVETSTDGVNYKAIGAVAAANSKKYEFKVAKLQEGKNYFRLKLVDLDGTFEYSKVEVLDNKVIKNNFVVFPNPVVSQLQFNWNAEGLYRYQILSLDGKQFKIGTVLKGINVIDMSNMPAGNYIIDVIDAKGAIVGVQKFIKQ